MIATCKICMEQYTAYGERVPKMLPCGHTFCRKCLSNIRLHGPFRCPTCTKSIENTPLQALPVNYEILNVSGTFFHGPDGAEAEQDGVMPHSSRLVLATTLEAASSSDTDETTLQHCVTNKPTKGSIPVLVVPGQADQPLTLHVKPTLKVKDVKVLLRVNHGLDCGRVVLQGLPLPDGDTLRQHNVTSGVTLHLDPSGGDSTIVPPPMSPPPSPRTLIPPALPQTFTKRTPSDLPRFLDFVARNKMVCIKEELANGCDVNQENPADGKTALHIACERGYKRVVRELLLYDANVNAKDANGARPLHLAAEEGHHFMLSLLLGKGTLMEACDYRGRRAVHLAAAAGHLKVLEDLEGHGCLMEATVKEDSSTCLHLAAAKGHVDVVRWLLSLGLSPAAQNNHRRTPVDLAHAGGHQQVVAVLSSSAASTTPSAESPQQVVRLRSGELSLRRSPNFRDVLKRFSQHDTKEADSEESPPPPPPSLPAKPPLVPKKSFKYREGGVFHRAVEGSDQRPAAHKVEGGDQRPSAHKVEGGDHRPAAHNPTTEKRDNSERLLEAAADGDLHMLRTLLQGPVNLEVQSGRQGEEGLRALHLAAWGGYKDAIELLLTAGADGEATAQGRRAVHWAAVGGHVEALKQLRASGCQVDALTDDSSTTLHLAADQGNLEVAQWLVEEAGLRGDMVDGQGRTAHDLSRTARFTDIAFYLTKHCSRQLGDAAAASAAGEQVLPQGRVAEAHHHTTDHQPDAQTQTVVEAQTETRQAVLQVLDQWRHLDHAFLLPYSGGSLNGEVLNADLLENGDGDLWQRIKEQRVRGAAPFREELVCCWTLMLTLALHYLHRRRLVHRDVRPQNVYFTEFGTLKLGFPRLPRILSLPAKMLSPEELKGGEYDVRTDMWWLGRCLYHLLTLTEFSPLNKVAPAESYSSDLRELLDALLDPCPEKRPTAQQVLACEPLKTTREKQVQEKQQRMMKLEKEQKEVQRQVVALAVVTRSQTAGNL